MVGDSLAVIFLGRVVIFCFYPWLWEQQRHLQECALAPPHVSSPHAWECKHDPDALHVTIPYQGVLRKREIDCPEKFYVIVIVIAAKNKLPEKKKTMCM